MGDFRADITVSMDLVGREYAQSWNINWTPADCCGVDRRVAEFFQAAYEDAYGRWRESIDEHESSEIEKRERAELQRLKAKYELTP